MIKLKIQSHLFLTINLNKISISLRKGENIIEVKEENLESLKSSLESFKCAYEVLAIKEAEANKDEELIALQEEAKALGIKGVHLFKDKKPLIEKINDIKNTKEAEIILVPKIKQQEAEANK